jgi:hypothetical protein
MGILVVWGDDLFTFTTNKSEMDRNMDIYRDELDLQDLGVPKSVKLKLAMMV